MALLAAATLAAAPAWADDNSGGNFSSKTSGVTVGTMGSYDGGPTGESSESIAVGTASSGTRSFLRRIALLHWDVSGGVRTGYAQGYSGPFIGVQADLAFELGVRPYELVGCWSPYVGAGGRFETSPDWILSQSILDAYLANTNKAGGSSLVGEARLAVGVSCVNSRHSILLYGFTQDAYRAPAGLAYPTLPNTWSETGGGVRLDGSRGSVSVEGLYGTTQSVDPNAESGTELGIAVRLRLKLAHQWALEAIADVSRYDVTPAGGGPAYPATIGGDAKLDLVTPL